MAKKIKVAKGAVPATSRKKGSQQQLYIFGGVVVVAIVLLAGVILITQSSKPEVVSISENPTYIGIPLSGEYAATRTIERASDVAETVSMGMDENGIPYIGDLDAPIIMADFADFTCPHCTDFAPTYEKLIADFARSGDALFQFYPVAAQSRMPESLNAARASLCAGTQGAFWEMHDEIFRLHRAESPSAFTPARLEQSASDIGLDGAALRSCMNTNETDAGRVTTERLASEYGVASTPTILYKLRGEDQWRTIPIGGEIGGVRGYDQLASIIRDANQEAGG